MTHQFVIITQLSALTLTNHVETRSVHSIGLRNQERDNLYTLLSYCSYQVKSTPSTWAPSPPSGLAVEIQVWSGGVEAAALITDWTLNTGVLWCVVSLQSDLQLSSSRAELGPSHIDQTLPVIFIPGLVWPRHRQGQPEEIKIQSGKKKHCRLPDVFHGVLLPSRLFSIRTGLETIND